MSLGLIADYSSDESDHEATEQPQDLKAESHQHIKTDSGDIKPEIKEDLKQEDEVKPENFFSLTDQDHTGDTKPPNEEESNHKKHKKSKKSKKEKLINPLKKKSGPLSLNEGSVFYNPFLKEQEAKQRVLEKHVKLSENPRDVLQINGKKMCAAYRAKGRCRFGHNCKFAHDSDLTQPAAEPEEATDAGPSRSELAAAYYNRRSGAAPPELEPSDPRKRKPGLARGLLPNKRSRQDYSRQQRQEAPWLARR